MSPWGQAPTWGARLPGWATRVGSRPAPEQTMDSPWGELLLMGLLLAVVMLSGKA